MFLAEVVIHYVKVKAKQLDLAWRSIRRHVNDRLEIKNFCQYATLSLVSSSLFKAFCLVLVKFCVQEELLLGGSRL